MQIHFYKFQIKKLSFVLLILLMSTYATFAYSESVQAHTETDRLTGAENKFFTFTFKKRTSEGKEEECEYKYCTITVRSNSFFINGFALLNPWSATKRIDLRFRIGDEIYKGECSFDKQKTGCYAKFSNVSDQALFEKIATFKGYVALETIQVFKKSDHRYEGQIQKSVWYADID